MQMQNNKCENTPQSLLTFPYPLLKVLSTSTGAAPAASPVLSGLLSVSSTSTLLLNNSLTSFSLRSSSFFCIVSTTSRTLSS